MILHPTDLQGLLELEMKIHKDSRGSFWEGYNIRDLPIQVDQVNFSMSRFRGTFRGLHYQDPNPQTKVVFATRGLVMDVVVDVRKESPTYLQNQKFLLYPDCGRGVLVPPGFAHGWLSLENDSQIVYMVEGLWSPKDERGIRYDDPEIRLGLPALVKVVAPRDIEWPLL